MTDNTSILRKIRALLARADEARNDNANEREIALRQAESLMRRHAIDSSELDMDDAAIGEDQFDINSSRWRVEIAWGIAELYGCKAIRSRRAGKMFMRVIGQATDRAVAMNVTRWLWDSIDREARRYAGDRSDRHAFRVGAAVSIRRNAHSLQRERKQAADAARQTMPGSTGNALVIANYFDTQLARAHEFTHKHYNVKPIGGGMSYSGSANSYFDGRDYADGLNLNRQVAGAGQKRLSS